MLLKEYMSQFVFVQVLALLVGLNALVTYRSMGRDIPGRTRLPLTGWLMVAGGHLMFAFWLAVVLEFGWRASLVIVLWGVAILAPPYVGWILKVFSLGALAGVVWMLVERPGLLAAMLFCITPMLALMGFIHTVRKMVGERASRWVTSLWLWLGVFVLAFIGDGLLAWDQETVFAWLIQEEYMPNGSWLIWDSSGFSRSDALWYGTINMEVGLLSLYAVFGLAGAIAVKAREWRQSALAAVVPSLLLVDLLLALVELLIWGSGDIAPFTRGALALKVALIPLFVGYFWRLRRRAEHWHPA